MLVCRTARLRLTHEQPMVHLALEDAHVQYDTRLTYLALALRVFGVIFVVGIPLMVMWVWPSGWSWEPAQPEYEQMIMGMYATLGVFLVLAARDPLAHASLIWFTVWSSIVHGGIMLVQALMDDAPGLPCRLVVSARYCASRR